MASIFSPIILVFQNGYNGVLVDNDGEDVDKLHITVVAPPEVASLSLSLPDPKPIFLLFFRQGLRVGEEIFISYKGDDINGV